MKKISLTKVQDGFYSFNSYESLVQAEMIRNPLGRWALKVETFGGTKLGVYTVKTLADCRQIIASHL